MANPAPRAQPGPEDAAAVARNVLGAAVVAVRRFSTGSGNFVFEVETRRSSVVVRFSSPDEPNAAATVHWFEQLRPLGVPVPGILAAAIDARPFPFVILERVPGNDLMHVYRELDGDQKRRLARRMAEIHRAVARWPEGRGFGEVALPGDRAPHSTWREALGASIGESRRRIEEVGAVDLAIVDRVEALLDRYGSALRAVRPTPYLHDTTTKNVIIDGGELSGIVDVDSIAYGDPLSPIALTRMSLLNMQGDTTYVDEWLLARGAPYSADLLDLYTAICGIAFLAELGQRFNQRVAPPVSADDVDRIGGIVERLVDRAGRDVGSTEGRVS